MDKTTKFLTFALWIAVWTSPIKFSHKVSPEVLIINLIFIWWMIQSKFDRGDIIYLLSVTLVFTLFSIFHTDLRYLINIQFAIIFMVLSSSLNQHVWFSKSTINVALSIPFVYCILRILFPEIGNSRVGYDSYTLSGEYFQRLNLIGYESNTLGFILATLFIYFSCVKLRIQTLYRFFIRTSLVLFTSLTLSRSAIISILAFFIAKSKPNYFFQTRFYMHLITILIAGATLMNFEVTSEIIIRLASIYDLENTRIVIASNYISRLVDCESCFLVGNGMTVGFDNFYLMMLNAFGIPIGLFLLLIFAYQFFKKKPFSSNAGLLFIPIIIFSGFSDLIGQVKFLGALIFLVLTFNSYEEK